MEARRTGSWKRVVKQYGSVYAGTDVAAWLREHDVDTVTLVGYMANNCILHRPLKQNSSLRHRSTL